MNFIYVIHLMCWNYLIDLITDNRNRNSKNRSNSRDGNNKEGRALRTRPPLLFSSPGHMRALTLDLVHELHLCHQPDVLELSDPPDHTEQTQKQQQQKQKQQEQKQQQSQQQQRGARAKHIRWMT